jgi:hypothetical protein
MSTPTPPGQPGSPGAGVAGAAGRRHRPGELDQPTAELGRLIRPYASPPRLSAPCDAEDRHHLCPGQGCECSCHHPEVFNDAPVWQHDRCATGDHTGCPGPAAEQGCECPCHTAGCPAWCTRHHPELHVGEVASIPNPANPRQPVRVSLVLTTDGSEPVGICVDKAEQMSPAVAAALVAALQAAVGTVGR